MIRRFRFAITYAWHNMARNPQRALFALFSVAAGVATVTTLRMLGLMLTDALAANAQAFLRSDILVASAASPLRLSAGSDEASRPLFLPDDTGELNLWAAQNDVDITYRLSGQLFQITAIGARPAESALALGYFIDPAKYPFYDVIRAVEPSGTLLRDLFTRRTQAVIAERLAEQLQLEVGAQIRIGTARIPFTVSGIVPDAAENNLDNPLGLAFSFVYLDYDALNLLGIQPGTADRAYLKLAEGVDPEVMVDQVYEEWRALVPSLAEKHVRYDRVGNILQRNALISGFVSRAVLLLGLVALLIGGVGILNTMIVTVKRRAQETAVLKTIGLHRFDIAQIFFTHALILGLFGSLVGIGGGILLSLVSKQVVESTFAVSLAWRIHPDPIALGLALGLGTTAVFSLLPTASAVTTSPRLLLRQSDVLLSGAGVIPILLTVGLLILGLGVMIDLILGTGGRNPFGVSSPFTGFLAAALVVGGLILAAGMMWLIVTFLSHLPTFKNPHLLLTLRGLNMQRERTAFTLLALVIGLSSLSATLILSRSISVLIYSSISDPLGGNVIVIPLLPLTQSALHSHLAETDGVTSFYDVNVTTARLVAVNNDPLFIVRLGPEEDLSSDVYLDQLNFITGIRTYGEGNSPSLLAGRLLTPEDAGHNRIVVPYHLTLVRLGVSVGSTFTYQLGDETQVFTIVGIVRPSAQAGLIPLGLGNNGVQAPIDVIPHELPFDIVVASVRRATVPELTASLQNLPGVFVLDLGTFDSIINRVLRQIAALPLLVAALSLIAASILIATTVSLSTMERRREIGVLKALGLKRRQVLTQLLVQNGLIGVTGGLLSLLPTLAIIGLVPVVTDELVQLPLPLDLILAMLALALLITIAATLLTGWSAAREKPTAALHYE